MNFLAHIYLSGENEELKIGNFIADSIKGKKILNYAPQVQNGIILHRAIDNFTDTHPIFKQSVSRLFPIYSHYSTVIVDILYDHFLAANWEKYSKIPLKIYTEDFYQLLQKNSQNLPKAVQNFMPYMINDNWLLNYASIEGIEKILFQMNHRTKNRSQMHLAVKELKLYYKEFQDEFFLFFDELIKFSKDNIARILN